MAKSRSARYRFAFDTPEPLAEQALAICKQLDREYPYLAEFHLNADGTYTLFSLHTIKRVISRHYGEGLSRTGWDVDWIERDQTYAYHMSSGGGSLRQKVGGIYWRHPAMLHAVREETAQYCDRAFRKRNKTRRLRRIPIDIGGHADLMEWLEQTGIDCQVYYCTICKEYLPDNEGDLCAHVWPCDDGILRGPGSTESTEPCDEDCYYCSRNRKDSEDEDEDGK